MQSKKHSIIESVANTVIGLVTSFIIQIIIYPLLDIPVTISEVEQNAMDVLEVYESAVPAMGVTKNSEMYGYQGLGILFPQSASFLTISYASMFEVYKTFDFPDDGWLQFLEAYWGVDLI